MYRSIHVLAGHAQRWPHVYSFGLVRQGAILCQKKQEGVPAMATQWRVGDATDEVLFNGVLKTLKTLVVDRRRESPLEAIMWGHKITNRPQPGNATFF